jgi:hypothetical protein
LNRHLRTTEPGVFPLDYPLWKQGPESNGESWAYTHDWEIRLHPAVDCDSIPILSTDHREVNRRRRRSGA